MNRMKLILSLQVIFFMSLCFFAMSSTAWATDYYVRPISGEYGDEDGSSYAAAFDGFADINWSTLDADNDSTKLFVCGNFQETMTVGASGEDGEPITVISCTIANGASTDDAGKIDGNSGAITRGIDSGSANYIVIDGLEIYNQDADGILVRPGIHNWTIQNNTIHDIEYGCDTSGADSGMAVWMNGYDVTIRQNTIYNACANSIMMTDYNHNQAYTGGNIVEKNIIWNSNHTLIEIMCDQGLNDCSGTTIRYNYLYHTDAYKAVIAETGAPQGHGIYLEGSTNTGELDDTYIYGNVISNIGGSGIFFGQYVDGAIYVYNNTSYNCELDSLNYQNFRFNTTNNSDSTIVVKNNIATGNSDEINVYLISPTNKDMDNNNWYKSSGDFGQIGGTGYNASEWDDWQTAGRDENPSDDSAFADPTFTDPVTVPGDFTLANGSPMIGNGEDLGNGLEYCLDPASSWPDNVIPVDCDSFGTSKWPIGAFEYVDGGSSLSPPSPPTGFHTVQN